MKNSSITFRTNEINKNKIKTIANKYNISTSSLLNIIISNIAIEYLDFTNPELKINRSKKQAAQDLFNKVKDDPYLSEEELPF